MKKYISILVIILGSVTFAYSQTFEIRSVNKGAGVLGVEMRETSGSGTPNSSNYITDIVFGITWDTSYGVDLASSISSNYNIQKSASRSTNGSKHFQAFWANNTPFLVPTSWTQNVWVEIAELTNTLNSSTSSSGTFEIAALAFNATTDPNVGINLTDFAPTVNGSAASVPVPVELISFEAYPIGEDALLEWETASEVNNSHFWIERGITGYDWKQIGEVKGSGTTNEISRYQFIDSKVKQNNVKVFYRLVQVDFDGEQEVSSVRSVHFTENNTTILYPVPSYNKITVKVTKNEIIERVSIQSISGKLKDEIQGKYSDNKAELDITSLPSGLYFARIKTDSGIQFKKFLIER